MNFHLKYGFGVEFTAFHEGRTVKTHQWHLSYMTRITVLSLKHDNWCQTSQIRSRVEYLIPSDSIIVLDGNCNLTQKNIQSAGFRTIYWWLGRDFANYFGPPCKNRNDAANVRGSWLQRAVQCSVRGSTQTDQRRRTRLSVPSPNLSF